MECIKIIFVDDQSFSVSSILDIKDACHMSTQKVISDGFSDVLDPYGYGYAFFPTKEENVSQLIINVNFGHKSGSFADNQIKAFNIHLRNKKISKIL